VADSLSSDVATFSIDPASGALTEVGAEVVAGCGPYSVTVDPSGCFVYVANRFSGNVTTFRIDRIPGALTEAGTEAMVGDFPTSIVTLGEIQ